MNQEKIKRIENLREEYFCLFGYEKDFNETIKVKLIQHEEEEFSKIEKKHARLREILIENGSSEYGDVIIDTICNLFGYPNTNVFEVEE